MLDDLQSVLRIYTRAFVAQGIGIVGLLWCLFDDHTRVALILTTLVLIDQAVFLNQRGEPGQPPLRWQRPLRAWCIAVSFADVLILFAVLFQAEGLRDIGRNAPVTDPLDSLAFSFGTFARVGLDLVPATATGRLLAAGESLLGTAVLLLCGAIVLAAVAGRRAQPSGADSPAKGRSLVPTESDYSRDRN